MTDDGVTGTTVEVKAWCARHVPTLVSLSRFGGEQKWDDMHDLVASAAYFAIPDVDIARLVEIYLHRNAHAMKVIPGLTAAVSRDAIGRSTVAGGGDYEPWSLLQRVPALVPDALDRRYLNHLHSSDLLFSNKDPLITSPHLVAVWGPERMAFIAHARASGFVAPKPAYRDLLAFLLHRFDNLVAVGDAALCEVVPELVARSVDLFVWGLSGAELDTMVDRVVEEMMGAEAFGVLDAVRRDEGGDVVFDCGRGLTLRVVRHAYASPDEILHRLDIAAFKVLLRAGVGAGAGTLEAWCTAEFVAAVEMGAVWIDPDHPVESRADGAMAYVTRIMDCYLRGFRVHLVCVNRHEVRSEVFTSDVAALGRLGKLLRVENDIQLILRDHDTRSLWRTYRELRRAADTYYAGPSDPMHTLLLQMVMHYHPKCAIFNYLIEFSVDRLIFEHLADEDGEEWKGARPARLSPCDVGARYEPFYHGVVCPAQNWQKSAK